MRFDVLFEGRNRSFRNFVLIETSLTPAEFVAVEVCYDPIDPGEEGGPRFKAPPSPEDANVRLLRQVARVGIVSRQVVGKGIGCVAVLLDGVFQEGTLLHALAANLPW